MTIDDVDAYAAEVRAELADLSSEDSAELLEDLEDHLREVAAEDAGALRERLGTPAAYASELRESAGLPPRGSGEGGTSRVLRKTFAERVAEVEGRIRGNRFGAETLTFVPTLRPAWWVLRAWLVVRFLEVLTSGGSTSRPLEVVPRVYGSAFWGLVFLLVAIVGSVWFARRERMTRWSRSALVVGQSLLLVFAVLTVAKADHGDEGGGVSPAAWSGQGAPPGLSQFGRPVTDLYIYDRNGKLLNGVFVFDQNNEPIDPGGCDGKLNMYAVWQAGNNPALNVFPRAGGGAGWEGIGCGSIPMSPPASQNLPRDLKRMYGPDDGASTPGATPSTPTPSTASP